MKARHKNLFFYLFMSMLLLVIIGYNFWSFRCGYCTISSLLSFSPPALLLLAGILIAAVFLLIVKVKNKQLRRQQYCHCGALLRKQWNHCPTCGQGRNC